MIDNENSKLITESILSATNPTSVFLFDSYAKRDLNAAQFLLNMHSKPLEIICYHCQQSAEKILNLVSNKN